MKKYLLFLNLLFSSSYCFADHYMIMVDAGSTGSRLHIFKYQYAPPGLPHIQDVFSESVKPGLSAYADQPENVGTSLKKPLDDAANYLAKNNIRARTTSLFILATAGMRLVPEEKQQKIYNDLQNYLKSHYQYPINQLRTITGKEEGLFGWLDVNYLTGTFQNNKPTVGSIDMGGASTQIAFATDQSTNADDTSTLLLNRQQYTVFSKSFLGMGQDQTLSTMLLGTSAAAACFPQNYLYHNTDTGHFNFNGCRAIYKNIIDNSHIEAQLPSIDNQSFIAYSGIYYTFNFFKADTHPDQASFEEHMQNVCNEDWEQLKQEYPQVGEKYLASYCAYGTYHDELLYDTYHLQDAQLQVTNQINQKDIDWTLGAALFELTQNAIKP